MSGGLTPGVADTGPAVSGAVGSGIRREPPEAVEVPRSTPVYGVGRFATRPLETPRADGLGAAATGRGFVLSGRTEPYGP